QKGGQSGAWAQWRYLSQLLCLTYIKTKNNKTEAVAEQGGNVDMLRKWGSGQELERWQALFRKPAQRGRDRTTGRQRLWRSRIPPFPQLIHRPASGRSPRQVEKSKSARTKRMGATYVFQSSISESVL